MYLLIGLLACCTLAALVSIRTSPVGSLLHRLRRRFMRAQVLEPVLVDRGWTVIPGDDDVKFNDWINADDFKRPSNPLIQPSLGNHLLIELYGCDPTTLEHEAFVRRAMEDAARRSEATIVTSSFHEFKPYGVSGAVIIQESHYTVHTWPEHRYAAVDLFYCSDSVLVARAVEALREHFRPQRTRFLVVRRGLREEVEGNP